MRGADRPVVFGEVLFDRFPAGRRVLGGAPFNVAWHLRGFGLDPLMVSRVGDDEEGREVFAAMDEWDMDTAGIQVSPEHATGAVEVVLTSGEPEFEILPDRAWDHIEAGKLPPAAGDGSVLYHGSLAARGTLSRSVLATLIGAGRPRFADVNLRAPWWNRADALSLLRGARWIKLNEDELIELTGRDRTLDEAAGDFIERCGADLVVVTRGRRGARAFRRSGKVAEIPPPARLPVVDTVGAGDGFAAVTIRGLLAEWPIETILERAQAFAGAIVGVRGATVRDRDFYDRHLSDWSAS